MDVLWQPNLFSSRGEVTVDAAFRTGRRTPLDARSWVEVFPGWLTGANELFQRLADAVPGKHTIGGSSVSGSSSQAGRGYRQLAEAPHPALVPASDALSEHYEVRYDNLWLNLYRGGEDSTGWHRDRFSCRRPECIVPVLTLGATRRFLLKPRAGGPSIALHPSAGDLVVMGGRCQDEWVHSVPKASGALGARISVNFQSSEQARRPRPGGAAP